MIVCNTRHIEWTRKKVGSPVIEKNNAHCLTGNTRKGVSCNSKNVFVVSIHPITTTKASSQIFQRNTFDNGNKFNGIFHPTIKLMKTVYQEVTNVLWFAQKHTNGSVTNSLVISQELRQTATLDHRESGYNQISTVFLFSLFTHCT